MKRLLLIIALIGCTLNIAFSQQDFRKETIYFLLTTRFFDGDSTNNAPNEWCSYIPGVNNPNITDPKDVTWRGDFKGLIQKLDYIKGMGFTAIWITPVVQNRSPLDYHGYHAWDFTKVDPRLESPGATFKDLIDAVHAKGMKLVLDIVTNHSGRYGIKGVAELKYNTDPTKPWGKDLNGNPLQDNPNWEYDGLTPNPADGKIWSRANLAKMPAPYNQNLAAFNWPSTESFVNTSNPAYYHHSGNGFVQGWDDTTNCYQRAIADDCPDLNSGSAPLRDYMFNVYKTFIDMGVDAFRWDTWKHMNKEDIIHLIDRFRTVKPDLFIFGEVAQKRFDLHAVQELNPHWYTWRGGVGTSPSLNVGVLDFYAEATFHNTFENGGAFSGVTDAARYDNLYSDPSLLVTWLDNHDFGPNNDWNRRYGGSPENLAACMNFMFTWRGIPCVYYGTEKQFKAGAYTDLHDASGIQKSIDLTGRAYYGNEFNSAQSHILYSHFRKLNAIRKAIPALQSGSWNWGGNYPGNGIGYVRTLGAQTVAVGLAKDGSATFNFTGLPNGIYRDAVTGREINVTNGTLSFTVASVSAGIYVLNGPGMIGGSGGGYFETCVTGCTNQPPTVAISPGSDNYTSPITVSIFSAGGNGTVTIYYTIDGSVPTTSSNVYTGPFSVNTATTIRAIAVDGNGKISDIEGQRYTFVLPKPTITITPASGNYFNPITVSITPSGTTAPYQIYYSTDGSTPTTSSALYTAPINITTATTIKAIARDANNQLSTVKSNNYTFIIPAPMIIATPAGGNYPSGNVVVSITANSPRMPVTIFYTIDGSTPSVTSSTYSAPISFSGLNPVTLKYIGRDNEGRISTVDSQRYTFSPIPDIWVYFKKPANWSSPVKIHYWNAQPTGSVNNTTWPGINTTAQCTNGDWWKFKFNGVTNVNVVFNDGAGKQTIDLTNITSTSYYDFNTKLNYVPDMERPIARLTTTPTNGAAPLSVNFDAGASSGCTQLSYFWDFGNGNSQQTSINPSSTQTYSTPGTYMVKVVVQDQNNNRDTLMQSIIVTPPTTGMIVHFKRPPTWTNIPRLYYWNTTPAITTPAWSGVQMQDEGNGWWVHTIAGVNCSNLIFNNSNSPQTPDLYKCGECWYDGGWINNPLPVNLVSFTAAWNKNDVVLNWKTIEEKNIATYTIEKSDDGRSFFTLGNVDAVNQYTNTLYRYTDVQVSPKTWYYRLRIVEKDGNSTLSNVVTVTAKRDIFFSIYPNPAKEKIKIENKTGYTGNVIINLYDLLGRKQLTRTSNFTNHSTNMIPLNGISAGTYIIQLLDKNGNSLGREKLIVE